MTSTAAVRRVPAPSFDDVYRGHFAFVWRSLQLLGVARAALDDAAQEVFLVVHRRLAEFEGRASLRTWLFAICRGVAANQRRAVARRSEEALPEDDRLASTADDPRAATERAEALRVVLGLLERLPEDQRIVLALVELEGLAVPEIAELLAERPNTVYSRLRLGRRAFEKLLAKRDGEARGREGR